LKPSFLFIKRAGFCKKSFKPIDFFSDLSHELLFAILNIATFGVFITMIFDRTEYVLFGIKIHSYTLSIIPAFLFTSPIGLLILKLFKVSTKANTKFKIHTIFRICLIYLISFLADFALMKLCIECFDAQIMVAKILYMPILIGINWILIRKYLKTGISK
jgi:hypothetical protein